MDLALKTLHLRPMKKGKKGKKPINLCCESTEKEVMTFIDIVHFRLEN